MINLPEIWLSKEQSDALSGWIAEGTKSQQFEHILDRLEMFQEYLLQKGGKKGIIYAFLTQVNNRKDNALLLKIAVDELQTYEPHIVTAILMQNDVSHIFLDTFSGHPDEIKNPIEKISYKNYIEKHAPSETINHMVRARDNLKKGNNGDCLGCCRKALESMAVDHSLNDALDELVGNNLIEDTITSFKLDKPLINGVYKYCSSYGSHDRSEIPEPSDEQTMYGYSMTEATIYFLIKLMLKNQSSKNLIRWKEVKTRY